MDNYNDMPPLVSPTGAFGGGMRTAGSAPFVPPPRTPFAGGWGQSGADGAFGAGGGQFHGGDDSWGSQGGFATCESLVVNNHGT